MRVFQHSWPPLGEPRSSSSHDNTLEAHIDHFHCPNCKAPVPYEAPNGVWDEKATALFIYQHKDRCRKKK